MTQNARHIHKVRNSNFYFKWMSRRISILMGMPLVEEGTLYLFGEVANKSLTQRGTLSF